jgi:ABC-type multidrug transport system ATPase subunit
MRVEGFRVEDDPRLLCKPGVFENFGLYFKLMCSLRLRQGASYFWLTYGVPIIFVLAVYLSARGMDTELPDTPNPTVSPRADGRKIFENFDKPIVVAPDTEFDRSVFSSLAGPASTLAFVTSQKDVEDGLVKEYEDGIGFILSSEVPSEGSTWSLMVMNEPQANGYFPWAVAAQTVCDEIMNSTLVYQSYGFPHPGMTIGSGANAVVGYLYAMPFVTTGLMKGVLLVIKLREMRVGFLFTLNGLGELCQSAVSLLIAVLEALPIIIIGTIIFLVINVLKASNVELFIISYTFSVLAYVLFMSAFMTILHSQKAFGVYMALAIILATGVEIIVQLGDYFPPAVLVIILMIFPFGNFIALFNHGLGYNGLRWDTLSLTTSGVSGTLHFAGVFVNFFLSLVICVLFNMCNPRAFGVPPIGWRNLFKLSVWKRLFRRSEYEEFLAVDVENVRKVYDGKTVAVDELNLSIKRGECILCVGANGAGKSTLLEMLSGAREPTSGHITACGSDVFIDTRAYHAILSIVFQDNSLIPNWTAREHIELFERLNGRSEEKVAASVDRFKSLFKMKDFIDNYSENLSGGSKRKLCLAIALVKNPHMLVCDEPCAGIDVQARQMIWRGISAYPEMTSFINVHSIDEAESMTSRILVMSRGKAKFIGTPAEMRDEFKCGYQVAILDETADVEAIVGRVSEIVPEVRVSPDHERTLMLPADLRVGSALEAIGEINYIVHLDSMEITIRKMIEDDEAAHENDP